MNEFINVTRPYLPPLEEIIPHLRKIWDARILTNNGPYLKDFEKSLSLYLGTNNISLTSNGTFALILALSSLKLSGEVITTPYSFVATTHALKWCNLNPVFVDIEPNTFNIDPAKIESAITPKTSAILAVHCYGNPCNVGVIESIAVKHNLKVIYDASHAFGVKTKKGCIFNNGDLSTTSFHATKVFNTFEGGAIFCKEESTKDYINKLRNFGFVGETEVVETGINCKMNEFQAALGLIQLKYFKEAILKRSKIAAFYRENIASIKGLSMLPINPETIHNYSYFPILVKDNYPLSRDDLYIKLKENNIKSRRYFYPLISSFSMYKNYASANPDNLPISSYVADRVLCLPIYPDLNPSSVNKILNCIKL